jgi:hypothetical protein
MSYACAYCGELNDRDVAFRCAKCSSSSIDEMDGSLFCDSCGEIRKDDLSIECGLCGATELATADAAL